MWCDLVSVFLDALCCVYLWCCVCLCFFCLLIDLFVFVIYVCLLHFALCADFVVFVDFFELGESVYSGGLVELG